VQGRTAPALCSQPCLRLPFFISAPADRVESPVTFGQDLGWTQSTHTSTNGSNGANRSLVRSRLANRTNLTLPDDLVHLFPVLNISACLLRSRPKALSYRGSDSNWFPDGRVSACGRGLDPVAREHPFLTPGVLNSYISLFLSTNDRSLACPVDWTVVSLFCLPLHRQTLCFLQFGHRAFEFYPLSPWIFFSFQIRLG